MAETTQAAVAPEPGIETDGIDTPTLVMWGFVSVVLVVSVMLAAAALFYGAQASLDQSRLIDVSYTDSDKVVTDQQGVLVSEAKPASEGKPWKISIEDAKRLVLKDLADAS